MFEALKNYVIANPEECIVLLLLIVSEILGSMDRFKANSVVQLLRNIAESFFAKTHLGSKTDLSLITPVVPKTEVKDPVEPVVPILPELPDPLPVVLVDAEAVKHKGVKHKITKPVTKKDKT